MNKCKYCHREIPNKDWQTENGCQWCDSKWRHIRLNHTDYLNKYYRKNNCGR